MDIRGRRIHIAGSADEGSSEEKLRYAHELVGQLTSALAKRGATFLFQFGKEPYLAENDAGPSIIFDWTIAESVATVLQAGQAAASTPNGRLVATIATSKTDGQIPAGRRQVYGYLREVDAVALEFLNPGWYSGSVRRNRMSQLGDVLIAISGGEGVEHLAVEYAKRGKPLIPLDLNLGSSSRDGSGGAARLFERALAKPTDFIRVKDQAIAQDLLDRTRTRDATTPIPTVVDSIVALIEFLESPRAFYVRLLNDSLPEYPSVEGFFRQTVDEVVKELGYCTLQMGIGQNEFAWMNEAVFDSLHHSAVAVVDLTGLRPNCFMELGYGLGVGQRMILTARDDTKLPFDSFAIETFPWADGESVVQRRERLLTHWERNIDMPHLVKARQPI